MEHQSDKNSCSSKKEGCESRGGTCGTGEGMTCPLSGCPVKKVFVTTLVIFAVLFGFEWLFHGVFMKPAYEATASLWRPEEEMMSMMHICIIRKFFMALAIASLYGFACKNNASCDTSCNKTGLRFGLMIGILMAANEFGVYAYLPIPLDMAISWALGWLILGTLIGLTLAFLSRCCKARAAKI
jgi:hypothetical protein